MEGWKGGKTAVPFFRPFLRLFHHSTLPALFPMTSRTLYYHFRPFIPRPLQIAIRRAVVKRKLPLYADVWPIDPATAAPPPGWRGWPDGKKFAFVITHDVETARGVNRCLPLARIDREYGFRSAFNFVAEDYPIPGGLRESLINDGFEIGLHGLSHTGNLYGSRKKFESDAKRINRYLEEWKTDGFRAPSMYHNLDWTQSLNVTYDSSTFDTDPFEPQSDGLGTIFPKWIGAKGTGKGYVELPYTLPQDFMLFVIMGEKSTDIWKAKLDWIAEHGGMALLLVHPDYISFDCENGKSEYSLDYYRHFLELIKEKYEGHYWNAVPREVAAFWINRQPILSPSQSPSQPVSNPQPSSPSHHSSIPSFHSSGSTHSPTPLRVCMLSYSYYDVDARVSRYAETLARRGDRVDVISLGLEGQGGFARINGVNVFRIQKRERNEKGKLQFLTRLLRFFAASSIFLSRRHGIEPYDLIHVHSVPDFEVFAAWLPKLKGTPVILDIHDIVPEFYAAKFGTDRRSFLYKVLVLIERLSVRFADHVIISNHIWQKTLRRSISNGKCSVVMNYPDPETFYSRARTRSDDRFVMMYPGTLNWHQGLDIALRAFAQVKEEIPHAEFHIYGKGDSKPSLEAIVRDFGLQSRVFFHDMKPKEQIAEIMANADLGVVPKRNDSFGGEAFSTKTLEFMSLGVPVLVAGTRIDRYYFNDSVVRFFEPEDEVDLATAMINLAQDHELRKGLAGRASAFVKREYDWEVKKGIYLGMVDELTAPCPADPLDGNGIPS